MKGQSEYDLIEVFKEFMHATIRNKRMLRGARLMKTESKENYVYLLRLLELFKKSKSFELRLRHIKNDSRTFEQQKRYFNQFYIKFTEFLFNDQNHFDNYVGHNIKMLKAFFKWVVREKGISIGEFYKNFHVWKEDIQIIVLEPEQLNFLITNKSFEASLSKLMLRTKDLFVFGCTVALRISDLLKLKKDNLEILNGHTYLRVISQKTQTYTRIKLPQYAVDIIIRNKSRSKFIFQESDRRNFNNNIKKLVESAGWTQSFPKIRTKRGLACVQYKDNSAKKHYRFCDLISTHTMRRTAISTMLNLGLEE